MGGLVVVALLCSYGSSCAMYWSSIDRNRSSMFHDEHFLAVISKMARPALPPDLQWLAVVVVMSFGLCGAAVLARLLREQSAFHINSCIGPCDLSEPRIAFGRLSRGSHVRRVALAAVPLPRSVILLAALAADRQGYLLRVLSGTCRGERRSSRWADRCLLSSSRPGARRLGPRSR